MCCVQRRSAASRSHAVSLTALQHVTLCTTTYPSMTRSARLAALHALPLRACGDPLRISEEGVVRAGALLLARRRHHRALLLLGDPSARALAHAAIARAHPALLAPRSQAKTKTMRATDERPTASPLNATGWTAAAAGASHAGCRRRHGRRVQGRPILAAPHVCRFWRRACSARARGVMHERWHQGGMSGSGSGAGGPHPA